MPPRCRCGKVACSSMEEARYYRAVAAAQHGHFNPVAYYQCRHGAWHWTSHTHRRSA